MRCIPWAFMTKKREPRCCSGALYDNSIHTRLIPRAKPLLLTRSYLHRPFLAHLVGENGVSMIQWRNLNIDPEWYFKLMSGGEGQEKLELSPSMGLTSFMKRLKKLCPWLRYGYFNPYLGEKAELAAPMPGEWTMPAPRAREAAAPEDGDDAAAGEDTPIE